MKHAFNLFFIMIALSFTNEGIYLKREKKSPLCGEISFTTIAEGNYSGISKKKNITISNQKDFEKIWEECYSIQIPKPKATNNIFLPRIFIFPSGQKPKKQKTKKTIFSGDIFGPM